LGTEGEKRTLSRRTDTGGSAPCDPEVELNQIGEEAEDTGEVLEGFAKDRARRWVERVTDESV